MMPGFEVARSVLQAAIDTRAFPAAVAEVGTAGSALWREAFGALSWEPEAAAARDDAIFDLASLTKVLATASLAMRLVDAGALRLDDAVRRWVADWRGSDRDDVRIRDLLAHAGGLTAWLPFFRDYQGRQEFQRAICTLPLEYSPRSRALYSDLGFILLGFVLEDAGGATLAAQFDGMLAGLGLGEPLAFCPPASWRSRTAPTERDPWRGRLLVGEVHDENAWALGGTAGHAGLFGTAAAVGNVAREVLLGLLPHGPRLSRLARTSTLQTFATRTAVPGSSRALGWDTMLPTSSCGSRMSGRAIGHTGFTGTSLWIDPERETYAVLLTNRVHPSRSNEQITSVRRAFHDAVMTALEAEAT